MGPSGPVMGLLYLYFYIKEDLNLHSEISFTLLWRRLEGGHVLLQYNNKIIIQRAYYIKNKFQNIYCNKIIHFFFSRCHTSSKK